MAKICTRCATEQPDENFSFIDKKKGWRQSWCKKCHRKYIQQRHRNKQEVLLDITYITYKRAKTHEHKAKKLGLTEHFTGLELFEQFERQGSKCYYCESPLTWDRCQIDHKTPLSRGGDNTIENIALTCRVCNYEKKILTEAEYFLDKQSRFGADWRKERQRVNASNSI